MNLKTVLAGAVAAALTLSGAALGAERAPDPVKWRQLDLENTLLINSTQGPILVEMYPEVAPSHVQRVKELVRERFYDGLTFHRVIDGFMAQTGDPAGDSTGGSTKPDLNQEFQFKRGGDMPFISASQQGGTLQGFYKTLAIETYPDAQMAVTSDGRVRAWALHCPGVASMARSGIVNGVDQVNSANSQFFLMRAPYPSLDKSYSAWGRVVWGLDSVLRIAPGSPPPRPDKMTTVRIMADLPDAERPALYVLRTDSPDFRKLVDETRKARGADFSICDVQVPARIAGQAGANEKDRPWWRNIPLIP